MYLIGRIFRLLAKGDAEEAHQLAVRVAQRIQRHSALLSLIAWWHDAYNNPKPHTVFGVTFPNRIGWAGGFDKNAQTVLLMQALGFGFGEVGTVLPEPQIGNPKPRYFYLPEDKALINRFGFNSQGAEIVSHALRQIRPRVCIPLGINLGKMKDTPNERAIDDYLAVWRKLRMYGKFGVANISSPNTPGLRKLQGGRYLESFVTQLVGWEREKAHVHALVPKPILIKIAPDLTVVELEEILEICERGGASGIIIGNTTLQRPLLNPNSKLAQEAGGLSGDPLFDIMYECFNRARRRTKLPLIAAGGIDSATKAQVMFDAGADLIEVLTGFVYKGPSLVSELRSVA